MTKKAIEVSNLTKIFAPNNKAVNNLDLSVCEGEVLALLGPNGAGKSTTIRILSTLSGFDEGRVEIDGIDIDRDPEKVRQTIGVVAQQTGVDFFMTGRENMMLQGRLYKMKKPDILQRIEELGNYFELNKSMDRMVSTYSGGMRRKLDIATALIHRPKILYLDEPTLGLDIHSRKLLWKYIEELNRKFGLTILLTTHYLEEADSLSDRVAIINQGKIQIVGTSDELKNSIHGDSVVISFDEPGDKEKNFAASLKDRSIASDAVWDGNNVHLYVDNGASSVPVIMEQAAQHDIHVKTLSLARPTLDDVFLKYTGTSMLDSGEEEVEEWWHQWAGKGGGGNWKKWADDDGDWEGNEWVNADGTTKGEWQDSDDWQGNEWVNKDGSAKPQTHAASDQQAEAGNNTWQGNEWVDKEGEQQGDWGNNPDWQGNEWVDRDGKPKADWSDDSSEENTQPEETTPVEETASENKWQGNEWVDKDGKPKNDWKSSGHK